MRELTARFRHGERGAVLLLVGVALVAMFAISALVIDGGHNLSERRQLITGTDAAALAAARAYAFGQDGCAALADDFLQRNVEGADLVQCVPHGDTAGGTLGWVEVNTQLTVDQILAGTIGVDSVTVQASSVAVFGGPSQVRYEGARPFGLCLRALLDSPAFDAWSETHGYQPGDGAREPAEQSEPIRIYYTKEHPDDCGQTQGTWGFIDFNGGGNSNRETIDWILNGHDGVMSPGTYEAGTGAISRSHATALQTLVDSEEIFTLPVFTEASGNGANAQFEIGDFLGIQLTSFRVTGAQSRRYLEFIIVPDAFEVACCAVPAGFDTWSRTTGLFALGPDGKPLGVFS